MERRELVFHDGDRTRITLLKDMISIRIYPSNGSIQGNYFYGYLNVFSLHRLLAEGTFTFECRGVTVCLDLGRLCITILFPSEYKEQLTTFPLMEVEVGSVEYRISTVNILIREFFIVSLEEHCAREKRILLKHKLGSKLPDPNLHPDLKERLN